MLVTSSRITLQTLAAPSAMSLLMPMVIGSAVAMVIWKAVKAIKHGKAWSGIN